MCAYNALRTRLCAARPCASAHRHALGSRLADGAFWYLFPSGRGLRSNGTVDDATARHLLLFHDNRFAADSNFIFALADQKKRG